MTSTISNQDLVIKTKALQLEIDQMQLSTSNSLESKIDLKNSLLKVKNVYLNRKSIACLPSRCLLYLVTNI